MALHMHFLLAIVFCATIFFMGEKQGRTHKSGTQSEGSLHRISNIQTSLSPTSSNSKGWSAGVQIKVMIALFFNTTKMTKFAKPWFPSLGFSAMARYVLQLGDQQSGDRRRGTATP